MSSISIAGDTSGSVIIAAPAVAGSTTLTLPTTTGTLVTSNAMPTGSVIQVVSGTISAPVSTTSSGTWVTTGLSASITPSSASNKIIAFISGSGYNTQSGGQCAVTLFRGATNLCPSAFMNVYASASITVSANTFHYVDSPATTSSTTYTVYFQNSNGSTTVTFNTGGASNNAIATLLLMEIKA